MNTATTRVLSAVCDYLFVTPEEALAPGREKRRVLARQVTLFVLREHQHPRPSYPELAREFPGVNGRPHMDHTTVMSAVRRVLKLAVNDDAVAGAIEAGREALVAAAEDQGRMMLLAKCQRRNELLRQIRVLDEEIGIAAGAAE